MAQALRGDAAGGLLDEPRPGAPRKIPDAQIERAIATALESTPRDATHWNTRDLEKHEGLSQSIVARIRKAFALQPHRSETVKLSKDPLFIHKVRDIVGVVLASAGSRLGALGGREKSDSGARSHRAADPGGARHGHLHRQNLDDVPSEQQARDSIAAARRSSPRRKRGFIAVPHVVSCLQETSFYVDEALTQVVFCDWLCDGPSPARELSLAGVLRTVDWRHEDRRAVFARSTNRKRL